MALLLVIDPTRRASLGSAVQTIPYARMLLLSMGRDMSP
jgi:hypothetical protein